MATLKASLTTLLDSQCLLEEVLPIVFLPKVVLILEPSDLIRLTAGG